MVEPSREGRHRAEQIAPLAWSAVELKEKDKNNQKKKGVGRYSGIRETVLGLGPKSKGVVLPRGGALAARERGVPS